MVKGTLENIGKNYFTDQRLVLRDENDNTVPVRGWLPMEMVKVPGGERKGELLSDYLGKTVELTATLVEGELPRQGVVYHLKVSQAKVADEKR